MPIHLTGGPEEASDQLLAWLSQRPGFEGLRDRTPGDAFMEGFLGLPAGALPLLNSRPNVHASTQTSTGATPATPGPASHSVPDTGASPQTPGGSDHR